MQNACNQLVNVHGTGQLLFFSLSPFLSDLRNSLYTGSNDSMSIYSPLVILSLTADDKCKPKGSSTCNYIL
ncbi:hypothetical protein XELAEV_18037917mg [Xenopus laevis]|uniref:Uncharacterized protein n=1 Tax=Xenopus laevis TaxID=8355 RepID=A0A974CDA9_XENLA|nr:hypothetical protein XELAEV_18037917mg [Xenopus laevis]